jgi:hypothetical protein
MTVASEAIWERKKIILYSRIILRVRMRPIKILIM